MLNLGASVEWPAYSDVGPLRIGRSRDAIKCYFEHPGSLRAIGWLGPPGVWAPREAGHAWPVAQAGGLDAQEPIAYAGQWESAVRLFLDACLSRRRLARRRRICEEMQDALCVLGWVCG